MAERRESMPLFEKKPNGFPTPPEADPPLEEKAFGNDKRVSPNIDEIGIVLVTSIKKTRTML